MITFRVIWSEKLQKSLQIEKIADLDIFHHLMSFLLPMPLFVYLDQESVAQAPISEYERTIGFFQPKQHMNSLSL